VESIKSLRLLFICGLLLVLLILSGCRGGDPEGSPSASPDQPPSPQPGEETEPSPTAAPGEKTRGPSSADADVTFVRAVKEEQANSWTFHVTVEHPDTGWEDYADGWDVVLPGGVVVKPESDSPFTRLLLHPHENEQPFTRSQGGIIIPEGVAEVRVRAHDLVDGFGGQEVVVDLTVDAGPNYEVVR